MYGYRTSSHFSHSHITETGLLFSENREHWLNSNAKRLQLGSITDDWIFGQVATGVDFVQGFQCWQPRKLRFQVKLVLIIYYVNRKNTVNKFLYRTLCLKFFYIAREKKKLCSMATRVPLGFWHSRLDKSSFGSAGHNFSFFFFFFASSSCSLNFLLLQAMPKLSTYSHEVLFYSDCLV